MSAWIEIGIFEYAIKKGYVALYMSAWIEICISMYSSVKFLVALYMSAWIEISQFHLVFD